MTTTTQARRPDITIDGTPAGPHGEDPRRREMHPETHQVDFTAGRPQHVLTAAQTAALREHDRLLSAVEALPLDDETGARSAAEEALERWMEGPGANGERPCGRSLSLLSLPRPSRRGESWGPGYYRLVQRCSVHGDIVVWDGSPQCEPSHSDYARWQHECCSRPVAAAVSPFREALSLQETGPLLSPEGDLLRHSVPALRGQ